MRQVKKMITDNCKLYFQSEKGELISIDRVQPLSDISTSSIDTERSYPSDFTIELEGEFSSTVARYAFEELFATEKERRFNAQCRKVLHRWFRENEPFINDLAKDIAAAGRSDFRILAKEKNSVTKVD